jgi:ABC-type uncharacterized transport system substrate-binding protein
VSSPAVLRPVNRRRRVRFARGPLALLGAIALWIVSTSAGAQVLAVLSDESGGYRAVVDELRGGLRELREGRLQVDTVTAAHLPDIDSAKLAGYELVVTVGLAAAQSVDPRGGALPPVLCLLIPRQSFEKLAYAGMAGEHRVSAVFIDQPLSRQLDLLHLALPDRHRLGIVLGPSSAGLADEVRSEAHRRGLATAFERVGDRVALYPALQALIPQSDLLLLLPDPVVINADTVYGLFVTSYRAQVPVIGFSEGLLRAGALISLYSTAAQQGRQGAQIARRFLAHDDGLPAPQYPRYFTVRVNTSVARSLGVHVPAEGELQAQLGEHQQGDAGRAGASGEERP